MAVIVCLSGCRLDMHVQPRYDPYQPSAIAPERSSAQEPVPGTVPRGYLRTDELLYSGLVDGAEADLFPFALSAEDLARGHERYDVYCSPCHGYAGYGDGMIVQRGFSAPPSFHSERLRQAPAGHFFAVMTHGFGKMYSYAARVPVEDRWRIAAYIRALQLSQSVPVAELSEEQRGRLPAP